MGEALADTPLRGRPVSRNFRTGRPYRGINVMLLWSCSYSSPFWLTFNQAKELNGSVRKGEKGTQIVFYKQLRDRQKTDDEQTAEEDRRAPFVLTYHTVFNAANGRRKQERHSTRDTAIDR